MIVVMIISGFSFSGLSFTSQDFNNQHIIVNEEKRTKSSWTNTDLQGLPRPACPAWNSSELSSLTQQTQST